MRTNPFSDALEFLTQGDWTSYVFGLLIIASVVIAAINLRRDPSQRSVLHLWNWLARFSGSRRIQLARRLDASSRRPLGLYALNRQKPQSPSLRSRLNDDRTFRSEKPAYLRRARS
jgi:hypothetical protein